MRRKVCLLSGMVLLSILVTSHDIKFTDMIPTISETTSSTTMVIDAGHGGFDGGAQAADGTSEQYINLKLAKDLYALCGLFGRPAVMTRSNEEALGFVPGKTIHENKSADLNIREEIAKQTSNPVFVSIHLNKFEENQYFGAQTFYSGNHPSSKKYAESIQASLLDGLQNGNTRKAKPAPKTVYLMNRLTCPALIVECGFLSNQNELAVLKQTDYQKRLALCILCGYLSAEQE